MEKKTKSQRGLGRGLSALMADIDTNLSDGKGDSASVGIKTIPIEHIVPNPDQPRKNFAQGDLDDLAASIREKGVIQPLILRVHPKGANQFEIVAGERRWRAAQMAQLHDLPAIVRNFSDEEVLEVAVIENIQRAELTAIEEAQGYRQLMDRFGHTQGVISTTLGKSRSHIANLLRLLTLPDVIQDMVSQGKISAGHARALVTADNPIELAKQVVARGLSVRETERLVKLRPSENAKRQKAKGYKKDADTRAMEGELSAILKTLVQIEHSPHLDGGHLKIKYKDLEHLEALCRVISSY